MFVNVIGVNKLLIFMTNQTTLHSNNFVFLPAFR